MSVFRASDRLPDRTQKSGLCLDCRLYGQMPDHLYEMGIESCPLCGIWANSKSFLLARGRRADRVGQQATQRTASTGMSGRIPISSEELLKARL